MGKGAAKLGVVVLGKKPLCGKYNHLVGAFGQPRLVEFAGRIKTKAEISTQYSTAQFTGRQASFTFHKTTDFWAVVQAAVKFEEALLSRADRQRSSTRPRKMFWSPRFNLVNDKMV